MLKKITDYSAHLEACWQEHLKPREAKRISSFPDGFIMTGKYNDAWARIGNSVPPLFMRSIARHVRAEILEKAI